MEEKGEDNLDHDSRAGEEEAVEMLLPHRHEFLRTRRAYCLTAINLIVLSISCTFLYFAMFHQSGGEFNAIAKTTSFYC